MSSLKILEDKDFDDVLKIILVTPFLSLPLDNIRIGEIRKGLDWQKEGIKKLYHQYLTDLAKDIEGMKMDIDEQGINYFKAINDILNLLKTIGINIK